MKSTIQTSRKIYAMKQAFKLLVIILAFYVFGKVAIGAVSFLASKYLSQCVVITPLDAGVFIAAITAIGVIVGALNIADGMKGHEPEQFLKAVANEPR